MPQNKLAKLRRMVEAMTPGELIADGELVKIIETDVRLAYLDGGVDLPFSQDCANAEGFVALRNNALPLIDVCEAAQTVIDAFDADKYGDDGVLALDALRAALEKLGNRTPSADLRRDGAASAKAE